MADLENLRKQAKQIVRWHRERHYTVAQQIREHLPRFASLDDPMVLDSPFQLSDAQELLARKAGFETWSELTRQPSVKGPDTPRPRAQLMAVEPQLLVRDMAVAIEHYRTLGFSVAFTYGEPPFYGQIKRDNVALNLRLVCEPVAKAEDVDLLSASVVVDDVKALFLEFKARRVKFHQQLRKEPWGSRTFIVEDPDGNLILFAG